MVVRERGGRRKINVDLDEEATEKAKQVLR
jgi:hypothetical protein